MYPCVHSTPYFKARQVLSFSSLTARITRFRSVLHNMIALEFLWIASIPLLLAMQRNWHIERLEEYRRKRDFTKTLEPSGADAAVARGCLYVMHKHAASHDHFDLRLEQDGVLRSWALPKGPSLEAGEKRLAVQTEDHPLEYGGFEGVIPEGEYGGGTIMLWDAGSWKLNGKNDTDHIDFILDGEKLKGAWTLVRTRGSGKRAKPGKSWLLIKRSDKSRRKLNPDDASVASGRSMEEIARDRDHAWIKGEARSQRSIAPPSAKEIAGARKAPFPESISPQLATLADAAPGNDDWLHEIKFDGYRVMALLKNGKTRLMTRNGHDWTSRFREQAARLAELPITQAILDGELVAMSDNGSTSFRKLQEALSRKQTSGLVFQAFDLLYLDGHDLTHTPLIERKAALRQLLESVDGHGNGAARTLLHYSDHIEGKGPEFFEQACTLGLEGIISKRVDARYSSGRSKTWLKVKCTQHAEFVVGGFTKPAGTRSGFGSLLLGAYDNDRFVYTGRVGTGFSSRQLQDLHAQLKKIEVKSPPFSDEPPDARGAHWVEPKMVIEVEFTERTRDGRLRHPSFRGLREDRDAEEIVMMEETATQTVTVAESGKSRRRTDEATVAGVRLTHPGRVLYPEQGVTKLDLARYYEDIQDWVMPYIARRPLTLVRCPEGRHKECFYQKHLAKSLAKNVPRTPFKESRGVKEYAYVDDISHLVSLVQSGVLEFHPFGSQIDDIEHPDMMVFDLDPSPGVPWSEMLHTARELHERLDSLGLHGFLRTTGGKGLHIVVPLEPKADWEQVKNFSQAVSELHAKDDPKRLTTNMSKSKRKGKIFIDYLRNARGATAIASYSARAREGAPVAVPLRWDELGAGLSPDRYNVGNLRRRLGALKADPWEDFFDARVALDARLLKSVGVS